VFWLKRLAIAAFLATALPLLGQDVAVLRNGFELRHERREVIGDDTRLYVGPASYVEVKTANILEIKTEEYVPPAPEQKAVVAASASASPGKVDVHQLAGQAANQHQIDQDFIEAVIKAESSGNPRARSPKGAQGLMQLMPQTAGQLGVADPYDAAANIDGGTRHLRALLEMYDGDAIKALAAYNAGANRVAQYHGIPPYPETQAYVRRIIRDYNARKLAEQRAARQNAPTQKSSTQKTSTKKTAPAPAGN
jgi:soluble lytic murein transglycosylase-like protein